MEATMATKMTVALKDDLAGGPAAETARYGLGTDCEINLTAKNATAFRQLAPHIEHARRAGREHRYRPGTTAGRPAVLEIRGQQ
jgi:hypothetical protein